MSTHFTNTSKLALAAVIAAMLLFPSWTVMAQQSGSGGSSAGQSGSGQGTSGSGQGSSTQGGSGQGASGSRQGGVGQGQGSSQRGQGQSGVGQNSSQGTPDASRSSGQNSSGRGGQGTNTGDRSTRSDGSNTGDRTDDDRGTSGQRSGEFGDRSGTGRFDDNRIGNQRTGDDRSQGSRNDRGGQDSSIRGDSTDRGQRGDDQNDQSGQIGANLTNDGSDRLMVRDIERSGVLGRAGLRDGDLIISANGRRVTSGAILARLLLGGGRVPLVIWRDGAQRTIYVDDGAYETRARFDYGYDDDLYQTDRAWLGVFLDTRYDNAVVVQAVQEGSAAERAGIRAGDRITSVNGRRVNSPSQLTQLIGQMEPGENVQLNVARWQTRQAEAQLGERPATSGRYRYLEDQGDVSQQGQSQQGQGQSRQGQSTGGFDGDAGESAGDEFRTGGESRENFNEQP